jgi:hypothetical protein
VTDTERDDLDNLLKSNGWLRFLAQCKKEWGPTPYAARLEQAVTGEDAHARLQALIASHRAINALLTWPSERIKQLDEKVARESMPPMLSRGGSL